jgi:hypothetical protein
VRQCRGWAAGAALKKWSKSNGFRKSVAASFYLPTGCAPTADDCRNAQFRQFDIHGLS